MFVVFLLAILRRHFYPAATQTSTKRTDMESQSRLEAKLRDAIVNGNVTAAKRLIKGGVNVNSSLWFEGNLLLESMVTGNLEIIKLLIYAGAQVNSASKNGDTALHMACRRNHHDIAKFLLEENANVNARTTAGKTPLHVALWQEKEDLAIMLLENGASVNLPDEDKWTSLHWAAKSSCMTKITQKLLDHGAIVNYKAKQNITPLHVSVQRLNLQTAKLLIENGADISVKPMNINQASLRCPYLRLTDAEDKKFLRVLLKQGFPFDHGTDCFNTEDHTSCSNVLRTNCNLHDHPNKQLTINMNSCILALSCNARNVIRKHLNTVHGGRAIRKYTQLLPLPQPLKEYLMFSEEFNCL